MSSTAAEPHPFNVHDLWAAKRVLDPVPSRDGRFVVFTCAQTDMAANRLTPDIWIVGADGGAPRRLTRHPEGSSQPQLGPDGRDVFFVSKRGDLRQVWRIPVDGGEAEQVTDLPLDVAGFRLSPDGKLLVVALEVFPEAGSPRATSARLEEIEGSKTTGRLYDRLPVRHWDTWMDGRRSHLFAVPVAGGDPVAITPELDADTPTRPYGRMEEVTFTPDSAAVVFAAHDRGREVMWTTDVNLFAAPVDGSGELRCLTSDNQATCTQPCFSPDGSHLAYLAMARPGFEADRLRVMIRAWPDGEPRALTESWDRSPSDLAWAPDGKSLVVAAEDRGQRSLFTVDVTTGEVRPLTFEGHVGGFALAGERVFFTLDNLGAPAELFSVRLTGSDQKPLTSFNAALMDSVRLGKYEQFTFEGWNNEEVHAYLIEPVDLDPKKKYPLAFIIHGGPQGSMGNQFHYRWNPQVYAGAGYATVCVDFHGSSGYGQDFCDSISEHWGDRPVEDLDKGLEAALERYPWLDGKRMAALGASFGGYMVNWLAGQWPGRFRCMVNHDGNLCERMAYFDTEELWFPEWEHGGTPWEKPESYERFNPLRFVGKWETPMLVVHSARDYRVAETHGLGTFTALQRQGIPSQLLYFPDENHWVLKPANSVQWHEVVLAWLDQWTRAS